LDGSFFSELQPHVLRQQRHDDLAEKLDGVLIEVDTESFAQLLLHPVLGEQGVERHQRACATADRTFRFAGRIA
jgi:hypothetical protein